MSKIYDTNLNLDTAINSISKIIMVIKNSETENDLISIISLIIDTFKIKPEFNNEYMSKLISLVSSVKTTKHKKNNFSVLLYKLTTEF